MTYFAVRRVRGPAWNAAVPMRQQTLWVEHAAFMSALIDAPSENAVRERLAGDPWTPAGLLEIARIEPWTILLEHKSARRPSR